MKVLHQCTTTIKRDGLLIGTWKQEEAFDSAHACEEAHNEGVRNC